LGGFWGFRGFKPGGFKPPGNGRGPGRSVRSGRVLPTVGGRDYVPRNPGKGVVPGNRVNPVPPVGVENRKNRTSRRWVGVIHPTFCEITPNKGVRQFCRMDGL